MKTDREFKVKNDTDRSGRRFEDGEAALPRSPASSTPECRTRSSILGRQTRDSRLRHPGSCLCLLLPGLLTLASAFPAPAQYALKSFTIDGGGGTSTNSQYRITGTIGQPDAGGPMFNGPYAINGGFWALPVPAPVVEPEVITWTNLSGGNWNVAANWQPHRVPGIGEHAVINLDGTYTVVVNAETSVENLTLGGAAGTQTLSVTSGTLTLDGAGNIIGNGVIELEGGTLSGAGDLTISNLLVWTKGQIGGSGRILIAPGATGQLANASNVTLDRRRLENAGTVRRTGSGYLVCKNGVVLTNRAGALWDVQSNGAFGYQGGATCRFDNAGTFRKTGGTGTTTFATLFRFGNYGTIELQSGTLRFDDVLNNWGSVMVADEAVLYLAGGGAATGSFEVAGGGTVDWRGGIYELNEGAELNGPGNYTNQATLTLNAPVTVQNFSLTGTLDGAGDLAISNLLVWTKGQIGGSGQVLIAPGATGQLANPLNVTLDRRRLENAGTVRRTGSGYLVCKNGVVLTNRPGALWEELSSTAFGYQGGATCRFDNAGTFRKTAGTGTTLFGSQFPFYNDGTIDIWQGTLTFNSTLNLSESGTVEFSLGGTDHPASYGRITTTQPLQLSGRLAVAFRDGFLPGPGQQYDIIQAPIAGEFPDFSTPTNTAPVAIQPVYEPGWVRLVTGDSRPLLGQPSFDTGGQFRLTLQGIANASYAVEGSTNLARWDRLETNTLPASAIWQFIDTDSTNLPYRFYRAVFLP